MREKQADRRIMCDDSRNTGRCRMLGEQTLHGVNIAGIQLLRAGKACWRRKMRIDDFRSLPRSPGGAVQDQFGRGLQLVGQCRRLRFATPGECAPAIRLARDADGSLRMADQQHTHRSSGRWFMLHNAQDSMAGKECDGGE